MSRSVQQRLNEFASQWLQDLSRDALAKMLDDTERFLNGLVSELKQDTPLSHEERDYLYIGAVLIRSLYDYVQIRIVLQDRHWCQNTDLLEYVWTKYCDCKDRYGFSQDIVGGDFAEHLSRLLAELAAFYQKRFGDGLYMSPEILIKRRECSICGRDFRACAHISGNLYDGIPCRAIAHELEPRSVSIVEHPEDPRCRLWPWNFDPSRTAFKGLVLTRFQIDDFLFSPDWARTGQPSHAGRPMSGDGPAKPDV